MKFWIDIEAKGQDGPLTVTRTINIPVEAESLDEAIDKAGATLGALIEQSDKAEHVVWCPWPECPDKRVLQAVLTERGPRRRCAGCKSEYNRHGFPLHHLGPYT